MFSGALVPFSVVFPNDTVVVEISQGNKCGAAALQNAALPPLASYVWAANDGSGRLAVALWQNSSTPTNAGNSTTLYLNVSLLVSALDESSPRGSSENWHVRTDEFVGVDMVSQSVFALPGFNAVGTSLSFTGVPVSDWPTLVVSRSLL